MIIRGDSKNKSGGKIIYDVEMLNKIIYILEFIARCRLGVPVARS